MGELFGTMRAFLIGVYLNLFKCFENYKDNLILSMTTENQTNSDSTSTRRKVQMK